MLKIFLIAARNLHRNLLRTVLTVLGASVAILVFIALRTVLSAWSAAADHSAKDRLATHHKVSFVMPLPKRYIDDLRAVPGVKEATFMSWFGGKNPKNPDEFFATMAVESQSFLSVMDEIVIPDGARKSWMEDKKGAIVGDVLAKKLGVKVGDRFTLQGSIYPGDWEFNISGIYTATRKSMDRSTFFFHWAYLNDTVPESQRDTIGWISTRVDDPARGAAITAAIDRTFDERDTQTTTKSEHAMNLSFMGMLSALLTALDVVSIIILFIMMMIVGNTIAMGVRERTREYGVLRALGFSPTHIRGFVIGEALALGLVAGIVGILISYPIVELMIGRFLEENMGAYFPYFRIEPAVYVAAMVLGMGLALVASILPAMRAARFSVTDALRRVA
jgi:putative ABC transport system permease protein